MSLIIKDRREQAHGKSTGNRQRFLRRIKETIKSDGHAVIAGSVGSTSNNTSVKVNKSTIHEPSFVYANNGQRKIILPGNVEYIRGDEINLGGAGRGNGGPGQGGDGEDDFDAAVGREEFLDFTFEGLVLPNLEKNENTELVQYNTKPAGFTTDGSPSRLSVLQSKKKAKLRKIALSASSRRKIQAAEKELDELIAELKDKTDLDEITETLYRARVDELRETVERLTGKIQRIPGFEELDLRYRSYAKVPIRTSSAVIFFVMDNSGSMGEEEKTLARKFFTLLFLFVKRKYGMSDVVFISHTTEAKEMTEEEFFNTHESGGTTVSTALKLVSQIIAERYSSKSTNIYVCQASDGDNWDYDNQICFKELANNILPRVQHYSYIQVGEDGFRNDTGLWNTYSVVASHVNKFAAEKIRDGHAIVPVFRSIFHDPNAGAQDD